jgi:hypothetical protein
MVIGTLRSDELFEKMIRVGRAKRIMAFVRRASREMCRLGKTTNGHYAGLQTVEVSRIQGSVDRAGDFDCDFLPIRSHLRDRWCAIARAFIRGEALPPVELILHDDTYYVIDGHHRVSVARALSQAYIDAVVTVAG